MPHFPLEHVGVTVVRNAARYYVYRVIPLRALTRSGRVNPRETLVLVLR